MNEDSGLFVWAGLLRIEDKRRVLRGLALLDEIRLVLAETAPSNCCEWGQRERAIDGRMRCRICGRPS
jgi:hypothetical protein